MVQTTRKLLLLQGCRYCAPGPPERRNAYKQNPRTLSQSNSSTHFISHPFSSARELLLLRSHAPGKLASIQLLQQKALRSCCGVWFRICMEHVINLWLVANFCFWGGVSVLGHSKIQTCARLPCQSHSLAGRVRPDLSKVVEEQHT